jgi:hypothetical protein
VATLDLQDEPPPEDEGIFVHFPLVDSALPTSEYQSPATAVIEPESQEPKLGQQAAAQSARRLSFNPIKLFKATRRLTLGSPIPSHASQVQGLKIHGEHTEANNNAAFASPLVSGRIRKPSLRSQPILIPSQVLAEHLSIPPLPTTPNLRRNSYIPSKSPYLAAPAGQAYPSMPSLLLQSTHALHLAPPPKVTHFEMQHMTPESVSFLREQEQLLIRRSAVVSQVDLAAAHRAFDESGEIGVAISTAPASHHQTRHSSSNNAATGASTLLPVPGRTSEAASPGLYSLYNDSSRVDSNELSRSRRTTITDYGTTLAPSPRTSFARPSQARNSSLFTNGAIGIHGSKSMVELDGAGLETHYERSGKGISKRKRKWWKMWKATS